MYDKAGPIVGILGILAMLGASITLFQSDDALVDRVDAYFRRVNESSKPLTASGDVRAQIVEVEGFVGDPGFDDLSQEKQARVHAHQQELLAYRDYEVALNKITPPSQAESEIDLRRIRKRLEELEPPDEYAAAWSETPAGRQQRQWHADTKALEAAVASTIKSYQQLQAEAKEVLDNAAAADLPGRARTVLDRASSLPSKEDGRQPVPNAAEVTYEVVFRFTPVKEVYASWLTQKKMLAKVAKKKTKLP